MAVASMVLGIVALVFLFIPGVNLLGIIVAIVGLVLGVIARKSPENRGMATAGMVCSIISLAICTAAWIACLMCYGSIASRLPLLY